MKKIIFIIIFAIAFILRIYNLGTIPSGFHADEASFLVNAISIAETGKDEDGNFLPITLRSLIDPKPALYSYGEIPFITLFGATPFATRIPAVLFGMTSLLLVYFLIKLLIDKNAALLSFALISISPWHINLSRGTQEVMMAFCFSIASLFFFLLLHKGKTKLQYYIFFFFFLFLSFYSYPSAKVFLPVVMVTYTLIEVWTKKISIKKTVTILAIMTAAIVAIIPITDPTRFNAVSIFTSPQTQLILNEKITTATQQTNSLAIRVFTNKITDYSYSFFNNYGMYFSGSFLFFGMNQPQRNQVPFTGILFPIEIIFLVIGAYYAFSQKNLRQQSLFMMLWLLAAPLAAAATTQEIPSITRAFPMLVPLIYFITIGILQLVTVCKKHQRIQSILILVMLLIYAYSFGLFWYYYTVQQPNYHPWYRKYEDEQVAALIHTKKDAYTHVYISNASYMYFVLNNDISIQELQNSYPHRLDDQFHSNKFIFVHQDCYFSTEMQTLSVVKSTCVIDAAKKNDYKGIAVVHFKDNNPAYTLYEYSPKKMKPEIQRK